MLEFKALTLDDAPIIYQYLDAHRFAISEYSFISLYIWRKAHQIEFCVYDDTLLIKRTAPGFGTYFMQPIGVSPGKLAALVKVLSDYTASEGFPCVFRNLEEGFAEELSLLAPFSFEISREENNFDYVYESEKLINLPGRKLSSKRNHFTRFINSYNYRVENLDEANAQKCMEASRKWCMENGCEGLLAYEQQSILDMLRNIDRLNFKGMVVYVDEVISAFTIGEIISPELAIIHIEKAFSSVHGLYTFINRTFAEKYLKDVKYINREDDMGLEGLRKAKESYHPYKLEYKYVATMISIIPES